jgi:adenine-specific DNA-methyltransferase
MEVKFNIFSQNKESVINSIDSYKKLNFAYEEQDSYLIKGDCLRSLKTLYEEGIKVDLVYIDPPFSTNTDFKVSKDDSRTSTMSPSSKDVLAYSDKLTGEEYLSFIRNVLIMLKSVMKDDASIYFHIDYKVGHYIKILMDEIFGFKNFRNDIARIKCNPKNFSRRSYGNIKDLILFYAQGNYTWNNPSQPHSKRDLERLFPKKDTRGMYTTNPLHAPGETRDGASGLEWRGVKPPKGRHWRFSQEVLDNLEKNNMIEWSKSGNPRKKVYALEQVKKGKKMQDIWEFKDTAYPQYPTQKNIDLLTSIVRASSNPGDTVLDCFAGSGTTLLASKKTYRKWIGIDQSEHAINIAKTRLEREKVNLKLIN